jgi:hypothetical protein
VKVGESAALFAAAAAWRLGSRAAGRRLVDGLSSADEESRQIAGMLIVKAGARAEPLLAEELKHPRNLPHLLRVIGDAAPTAFTAELERYAASDDEAVRQAARDALRAAASTTARRSG